MRVERSCSTGLNDANAILENNTGMGSFYPRLEAASDIDIRRTLEQLPKDDITGVPGHRRVTH